MEAIIDIKKLIREYKDATMADKIVLKRQVWEWILMQSIDESDVVELDLSDIEFVAMHVGIQQAGMLKLVKKTVRGYELWYGTEKVEIWKSARYYNVFFYPFDEFPGMVGPKSMIVNIHLSDDLIANLEEEVNGCTNRLSA